MTLPQDALAVGVIGADATHVLVCVRSPRWSWTKMFPRSSTVIDLARLDWETRREGWTQHATEFGNAPVARVFEFGRGTLHVTDEVNVTRDVLRNHEIDVVISLNAVMPETARMLLAHAGEAGTHVCSAPVRDAPPEFWDAHDQANARLAVQTAREAMETQRRTLIHCLMGVHRAPSLATALIAYALEERDLRVAYSIVHARRRVAKFFPETIAAFHQALPKRDQRLTRCPDLPRPPAERA